MRYEHIIPHETSKVWPYRVVCVDEVDVDDSEVNDSGLHTPKLARYTAMQLVREEGEYKFRGTHEGSTVEDFWRWLRNVSDSGRSITVVSNNCTEQWAMLGLWTQLEISNVQFYPEGFNHGDPLHWAAEQLRAKGHKEDKAFSIGAMRRLISANTGFIVMSAPPMMIRCKLSLSKCWITWIDMQNYGIAAPAGVQRGADMAYWLCDTWRRYSVAAAEYQLGKHCATAGSQAYYGFRYHYYAGGIATQTGACELRTETAGCHAGRAECYRIGRCNQPLWYLDVSSCYAAMCWGTPVPVRLHHRVERGSTQHDGGQWPASESLATVRLVTDTPLYPVKRKNLTIWPVGSFVTTLCGPELSMAFARGHVHEVIESQHYVCEYALRDLAGALIQMRERFKRRGDKEMTALSKLLVNALVGQFAKKDIRWEHVCDPDNDILWGEYTGIDEEGNSCKYRSLGGVVQREVDAGYSDYAVPAINGWITSAARVELIRCIESAGWENVYYCDTDALMVDEAGYQRIFAAGLLRDNSVGFMGERWGPCSVTIRGIKYYEHDGIVVCAGLPDGQHDGDYGTGTYEHIRTAREDIQARAKPSASAQRRGYIRSAEYRHGVVDAEGRVTPFVLEE